MNAVAYALITPAKNEEGYIERTIQSVVSQSVRPQKWVIVDDGSSDNTAAIADAYACRYPWITVARRSPRLSRDFASKARSFALGYEQLKDVAFDYLGNLDAEISFAPNYYERLFDFFRDYSRLGVAGGKFYDIAENGRRYPVRNSPDSVRGAVQMFRRKCYEDVGGYLPMPTGGIDSAAEITARMKGWKVRTFPNLTVLHHRLTGTGGGAPLFALVRSGFKDRSLGYYGLFEVLRCAIRLAEPPYVIGGLSRLVGYCWSWMKRDQPLLPSDTVRFLHREQRGKLVRALGVRREKLRFLALPEFRWARKRSS